MFSRLEKSHSHFQCNFDEEYYLERTKRNHYWLGGLEGQNKLKNLKVGIAGLGGMGSNLAEIMVRLGVGHIKIADPDTIEISNINRQVIATKETVGQKKAIASANELRKITEDFELVVYDDGITAENAEEFVSELDVIIDEIVVFPFTAHTWLHREANKLNIPLYSGFIIGLGTHVYKFQGNDYTFEDFMENDFQQIQNPTMDFTFDRLVNPPPTYMSEKKDLNSFSQAISEDSVPIFGTSTFISHSLLAIRLIVDYLGLNEKFGGAKTPTMPEFMKLDPFDMTFQVHDITKQPKISL